MRTRLLLLSLLLVTPLFAQTADIQVAIETDKPSVQTGERFTATIRVKNAGPDAARVGMFLQPSEAFAIRTTAPSGWTCDGLSFLAACSTASLAAGSEALIVLSMLAPPRHGITGGVFPLEVNAHPDGGTDPVPENNHAIRNVQLTHTDMIADLGVTMSSQQARENTPVTLTATVTNHGPTEARNVLLILRSNITPFTAAGNGWTCATSATHIECTRTLLEPGASAPLTIGFTTPSQEGGVSVTAHVRSQGNQDGNYGNDNAFGGVSVGSPESWRRILLPLAASETPGAGGSRWRARTTMLIANPIEIEMHPHPCEFIILHCFGGPLFLRAFDAEEQGLLLDGSGFNSGGAQFFFVRPNDESKLRINSRVYDVAREDDTAGSEIPIARENDFSAAAVSMLGIPVRSQYRYTLRIYDGDGRDGAQVAVRLFADDESEPRTTFIGTLRRTDNRTTTTAGLPVRPAYLQLDPAQLGSLEGMSTLRVDLEPLTPGVRIWAFVSVTDNDTHHVTTFSAR